MTAVIPESLAWLALAACADADPVSFFGPDGEKATDREQRERAAKRVCAGCPVITDCLGHALDGNVHFGVWGGLGEDERRAHRQTVLRRRREQRQRERGTAA